MDYRFNSKIMHNDRQNLLLEQSVQVYALPTKPQAAGSMPIPFKEFISPQQLIEPLADVARACDLMIRTWMSDIFCLAAQIFELLV